MNLTKRKESLGPISLDNIDIMQNQVVLEENLLDKDDFDMDLEAIEEPLITYSKIIKDEITKSLLNQMKVNGMGQYFWKLENINCDNE